MKKKMENLVTSMDSDVSSLAEMICKKSPLSAMKVHGNKSHWKARESLGLKLSLLIFRKE